MVDAVPDLVGGDTLRTVATLPREPAQLMSVADEELVKQLGGREIVRDRSTAVLGTLAGFVADGALTTHVTEVIQDPGLGE